ncbi:MAG: hypothetical protein OHK0046_02450 [Anaerolineae bacterium]
MENRRDSTLSSRAIITILALGIILRLLALFALAEAPLDSDALAYHKTAVSILSGEGVDPFWPPGLPLYLSVIYAIFGISEMVGRAAMIVFYVLMSAGLYWLARDLLNVRAANLIVLVFTLFPTYIYHAVTPLTHLPVTALLVLSIYAAYRLSRQSRPAFMLVLGLALGLMILTRAGAMTLLAFIPLYLLIRTRRLLPVIVPALIALLIVGAYLLHLYQRDNHFIFINYANSFNLFVGNNPDTPLYRTWLFASDVQARTDQFNLTNWYIINTPPYEQDQLYREEAIAHIIDRPDLFAVRTLSRMRAYFGFDTFTGARLIEEGITGTEGGLLVIALDAGFYMVIMGLALVYLFMRPTAPLPVPLLVGAALVYALPYFIAFSHATYHFPTTPLFALLAVGALAERDLWPQVRERRAFWLVVVIFAVIQVEWAIELIGEFFAR